MKDNLREFNPTKFKIWMSTRLNVILLVAILFARPVCIWFLLFFNVYICFFFNFCLSLHWFEKKNYASVWPLIKDIKAVEIHHEVHRENAILMFMTRSVMPERLSLFEELVQKFDAKIREHTRLSFKQCLSNCDWMLKLSMCSYWLRCTKIML